MRHRLFACPGLRCFRIEDVADIDFSLLDVPRDAPPEDADAYLRTAMAWHFGADTGFAVLASRGARTSTSTR